MRRAKRKVGEAGLILRLPLKGGGAMLVRTTPWASNMIRPRHPAFLRSRWHQARLHWSNADELSYGYLQDGQDMDVHDLHATMLRLCGVDHTRLSVRYQGRDFRLTDVHGRVIDGIMA